MLEAKALGQQRSIAGLGAATLALALASFPPSAAELSPTPLDLAEQLSRELEAVFGEVPPTVVVESESGREVLPSDAVMAFLRGLGERPAGGGAGPDAEVAVGSVGTGASACTPAVWAISGSGFEFDPPLVVAEADTVRCTGGLGGAFSFRTWHGSASARVPEGGGAAACIKHETIPLVWLNGRDCRVNDFDRVSVHGRVGQFTFHFCHNWCRAYDYLVGGIPTAPAEPGVPLTGGDRAVIAVTRGLGP